eukprot:scaffold343626_cov32-Prasinocladus_malaysianus.AAC.1
MGRFAGEYLPNPLERPEAAKITTLLRCPLPQPRLSGTFYFAVSYMRPVTDKLPTASVPKASGQQLLTTSTLCALQLKGTSLCQPGPPTFALRTRPLTPLDGTGLRINL